MKNEVCLISRCVHEVNERERNKSEHLMEAGKLNTLIPIS